MKTSASAKPEDLESNHQQQHQLTKIFNSVPVPFPPLDDFYGPMYIPDELVGIFSLTLVVCFDKFSGACVPKSWSKDFFNIFGTFFLFSLKAKIISSLGYNLRNTAARLIRLVKSWFKIVRKNYPM